LATDIGAKVNGTILSMYYNNLRIKDARLSL